MKNLNSLIILSISLLFVFILLMIPSKSLKREQKIVDNLFTSYATINKNTGGNFKLEKDINLSNRLHNLVYYDEINNIHQAYLINRKTGKIVDYKAILKKDFYSEFNDIEQQLLLEKYPQFIVNGIYSSPDIKREVEVLPNEIKIYYQNVVTEPMVLEQLYLIINNNEISKYLNYEFSLDEEYKNESAYDYDPTKKYIAFTFDDGPSDANTKEIIDFLNKNKSTATFFMLGKLINNYPDIPKYALDNNMEVGSHTFSHSNLKKMKLNKVAEEINNTNEAYFNATGETFTLVRPPYGSINEKIKSTFDYTYILWSVDTEDWRYKDADYVTNHILKHAQDGDIILMHDIHPTTKEAVFKVVPELYVRGYRIVSVSELARIKGVELEKHVSYRHFKQ